MWYVAQIRLLPAGGLAILGGTKFRKIAAYLFLLWAGLASGMILTSALLMPVSYTHLIEDLPSMQPEQVETFKEEAEEEVQLKLNV